MPRGFGKSRWELTVKESTRRKIAAQEGVDVNLEVTRRAGLLLDQFGEYGVVFNGSTANAYLGLKKKADLFEIAQSSAEKACCMNDRVLSLAEKASSIAKEATYQAEGYKSAVFRIADALVKEQDENKRLRALLEEHCQGCPASELK